MLAFGVKLSQVVKLLQDVLIFPVELEVLPKMIIDGLSLTAPHHHFDLAGLKTNDFSYLHE